MQNIAFTGSRTLSKKQEKIVYGHFLNFLSEIPDVNVTDLEQHWHVGDANGLDHFVRRGYPYFSSNQLNYKISGLTLYEVDGTQRHHFAERSKRMISSIKGLPNPYLYAFPVKPCPDGCRPCSNPTGKGSGTWLTIAFATYHKIPIRIFKLANIELPPWLVAYNPPVNPALVNL